MKGLKLKIVQSFVLCSVLTCTLWPQMSAADILPSSENTLLVENLNVDLSRDVGTYDLQSLSIRANGLNINGSDLAGELFREKGQDNKTSLGLTYRGVQLNYDLGPYNIPNFLDNIDMDEVNLRQQNQGLNLNLLKLDFSYGKDFEINEISMFCQSSSQEFILSRLIEAIKSCGSKNNIMVSDFRLYDVTIYGFTFRKIDIDNITLKLNDGSFELYGRWLKGPNTNFVITGNYKLGEDDDVVLSNLQAYARRFNITSAVLNVVDGLGLPGLETSSQGIQFKY